MKFYIILGAIAVLLIIGGGVAYYIDHNARQGEQLQNANKTIKNVGVKSEVHQKTMRLSPDDRRKRLLQWAPAE